MNFNVVPASQVDMVWPSLEPMILRGLKHGQGDQATCEDLKRTVTEGKSKLLVAHNGSEVMAGAILKTVKYPGKSVVFVDMLAGKDRGKWLDKGIEMLFRFMEVNNADALEASCRSGMARVLESKGWKRKAVIMEAIR